MSETAAEAKAFSEGALVVLSIGKKSWSTRLTPQDMGLTEFPSNWKPGRRLLLPDEALQKVDAIEGQARRYLDSRSFQFGKRQARVKFRFVHVSKLRDTLETLKGYSVQYFEAVTSLVQDYEKLKKQMEHDYPEQWPALQKLYVDANAIEKDYYFFYEPAAMIFPDSMTVMKRYEIEQTEKRLKEAEAAKDANIGELRRQAEEHRRNLERDEHEFRQQAESRVDEFVEEAVKSLRELVVKTFQQITDKIKDKKSVIKTNVDSLREVIAHVRDMDFLNDQAFHRQLDQVRDLLDTTSDFKDNDAATAELNRVLNGTIAFVEKTTSEAAASAKKTYFARKLAI